ncbi:hypothetical protein, partial [Streptomyces sp. NPDC051994]|uniref:hypothetical protein n=1 Tax=unclassified Streptomyces TaxID=2593676 RepID=UPI00343CB8AD
MPDQPEPHRLTDDELLSWLVVDAYRQLQHRDGVELLLRPWPPCPVCNSRTTGRIMRTSSTFDPTMILDPCGHTLVAREVAIAENWPLAEATAKQIADTPAGVRAADEYTTAKKPSADDRPDPFRLLLDQFTANAVQAARAKRADRSDEARTAHQTIAAVWTQAAHLLTQTIKKAGDAQVAGANPAAATIRYSWIKGRCPACRGESLFIADGGYVTCSRHDCPDPDAASTLLERRSDNPRTTPDDPVTCPDCAVRPGDIHADGCDVPRCPITGKQRLTCDQGDDCAGHLCRTRWTGQLPITVPDNKPPTGALDENAAAHSILTMICERNGYRPPPPGVQITADDLARIDRLVEYGTPFGEAVSDVIGLATWQAQQAGVVLDQRIHDGSCSAASDGTEPNNPATSDLRERYAAAIRGHGLNHLDGPIFSQDDGCCADAVLAVRDPELEQLRKERDMLGRETDRLRRDWTAMRDRADTA